MDKPAKSPDAFRTISEVSDILDVPQHVLRFWEGKFSHIKPMKRGGNRRYYRPEDLELLRAITHLLYTDGYTIKGVQKLLRENGVRATVNAHIAEHGAFQDDRSPEELAASVAEAGQLEADNAQDNTDGPDEDEAALPLDEIAAEDDAPEAVSVATEMPATLATLAETAEPASSTDDLPTVDGVIAELKSIQAMLEAPA